MKLLRITKIKERPNAEHPNNIKVGTVRESLIYSDEDLCKYGFKLPRIGENYLIEHLLGWFRTSPVVKIHEWGTNFVKVTTLNSVYEFTLTTIKLDTNELASRNNSTTT